MASLDELVLHPRTAASIAKYLESPSHCLLIVGPDGIGKTALATSGLQILMETGRELSELSKLPNVQLLQPVNGTISIERIRDAQRFLQHKTTGAHSWRRAILIEHADQLTTEAQNALLKTLEEPPLDTLIVLTATAGRALLPTVLSRTRTITAQPPSEAQLREHFSRRGYPAEAITQAYFLTGGLPGLMHALLANDQTHPLRAAVEQAKALLRMNVFERLAEVDQLSKKKPELEQLLEVLLRIAEAGLRQAATKRNTAQLRRWQGIRSQAHTAQAALMHSANPKLVITNLMLHI